MIRPMLAQPSEPPTLVDGRWVLPPIPFDQPGWVYEPKLDGERCIAIREQGRWRLQSRVGNDITGEHRAIADTLQDWPGVDVTIDGELIAFADMSGRHTFNAIQNHRQRHVAVILVPFDILTHGPKDLQRLPLSDRRRWLDSLMLPFQSVPQVREGRQLWHMAIESQWEGIIAKPLASAYRQNGRGPWMKFKRRVTSDMVVIGYTSGEGSRFDTFGALLLAQPDAAGRLRFTGKVGTGFDAESSRELLARLRALVSIAPSVHKGDVLRVKASLGGRTVTWVRPELVAVVEHGDRTASGHPWHPSYKGLRDGRA